MKVKQLFAATLALALTAGVAFAGEVNMDVPYGDREPGGYQHLTTHYHNYWRHHHHPYSNIEAERHVVREAQDLARQTDVWEGEPRQRFVRMDDQKVREEFNEYLFTDLSQTQFSSEIPEHVIEQIKNRPSFDQQTVSNIRLNEELPSNLSYNDLTYLPDEFTRSELHMPAKRYKAGLIGNDLVLYDTLSGRVRGLWRDIIQ